MQFSKFKKAPKWDERDKSDRIAKNMVGGKRTLIKRLNLMKGRFYYPATVHRRAPSYCRLVRNTAINSLNNVENQVSPITVLHRMYEIKKREDMAKASMMLQNLLQTHGAAAFQHALAENGVNGLEEYTEEEDPDYVPPTKKSNGKHQE
eukprot:gene18007-21489_t